MFVESARMSALTPWFSPAMSAPRQGDRGRPYPVTDARLASTAPLPAFRRLYWWAAAASASDGELMIETDGDNLGASHVVMGQAGSHAFKVAALRLQRISTKPALTMSTPEDRRRGL